MKVETLTYTKTAGWSAPFPHLDSPQTLVMVFASPEFLSDSKVFKELKAQYPNSKIVGCSTAGNVCGPLILDESLTVAITQFEKTRLKAIKQPIQSPDDSFQAGVEIVNKLNGNDLQAIFILSDGLNINGSELVNGLNKTIDKKIVISGGLAADGQDFKKTWTVFGDELESNQIIAIGFYGDFIQIGHGCRGGWNVFGPERRITLSKNNILYELDDQPALALYTQYLGKLSEGLPATGLLFPLAIWAQGSPDSRVVRTILAIDEKNQSLTFAGGMPEGFNAQLMRSKFDNLISSAGDAGISSVTHFHANETSLNNPLLSIAISCVGRRLLLGERTEEETQSVLENLPPQTKQVGFYSYGELSPHGIQNCDLHNQTMTLTTFYEK